MTESELAEAACFAAEALNIDLGDPACFAKAEAAVRAAETGLFEPRFDNRAVSRFLAALSVAAEQRGVPPAELWSALDALER